MNPLKKTILAMLAGLAVALYATPSGDTARLAAAVPLMVFYAIGFVHGWKVILRWAGKALSIGTDLTFWVFFLLLFRRGFFWGSLVFCLLFSFAAGIGCWIGVFIGLRDTAKYLFGDRKAWDMKGIFPATGTEAYLCLLLLFLKYNIQAIENNAVDVIKKITGDEAVNSEILFASLEEGKLDEFYRSLEIYKEHCSKVEDKEKAELFMSYLLYLIDTEDKLTVQGKEFLLLLAECLGWGKEELERVFKKKYGRDMPEPDVPGSSSFAYSHGNDSRTRRALRTLGLPDDFDLNTAEATSKIRQAYHEKAKEFHPDLNPEEDGEKMVRLTEAFNFLQERYFRKA